MTSEDVTLDVAKLLKLCCDKAHAELNRYSILSIDDCLQMTAYWYKEFTHEIRQKTCIHSVWGKSIDMQKQRRRSVWFIHNPINHSKIQR